MKKISITMVSLVGMTGLVFAQGAPKQPDPKAGGGAAVGAGVKVDAKAGAGAAAGAAGAAGGAAKAGAGAAGGVAAGAAVKVEMPKPPAEIAATLKAMGTRMNCTGTGLGPDMRTEVAFKGTGTQKLALDGWFIMGAMTGTMTGADKKKVGTMKMESYMTWDAGLKKWRTIGVMNDGSTMHGTATMDGGKYEGTAEITGAMGVAQMREHGDMTDPKAGMKMWGEMSMDKGKTWIKVYDMTCKK